MSTLTDSTGDDDGYFSVKGEMKSLREVARIGCAVDMPSVSAEVKEAKAKEMFEALGFR
jgi:hypothetical protein